MLESRGDPAATQDRSMIAALSKELDAARQWLEQQANFRCIEVPYGELVSQPDAWISRISLFLDAELDQQAMAEAIDPTLYRHRAG
jgi:hypothetical protein